MKPVLEYLPPEEDETFFAKDFDYPFFATPWHYHPEYELVLVVKSQGKRFIGNAVSEFKDGDLTLIGPNLPHLYRNPQEYYENNPSLRAQSVIIHFLEQSVGAGFLALPQLKKINRILELAKQGIDIYGETKKTISDKMYEILDTHGFQRLMHLLEILHILSNASEIKLISDPGITGNNPFEAERLDLVFQYISKNFDKPVQLEEVASLIHMTRCSFCRFFKERTKRSFSSFLIDVRLNHAVKLLIEGKEKITSIAYRCGYNNLSNFNRQFKDKFKVTPKQYRNDNFLQS